MKIDIPALQRELSWQLHRSTKPPKVSPKAFFAAACALGRTNIWPFCSAMIDPTNRRLIGPQASVKLSALELGLLKNLMKSRRLNLDDLAKPGRGSRQAPSACQLAARLEAKIARTTGVSHCMLVPQRNVLEIVPAVRLKMHSMH